jgi:N-acetylornithine carbamoyltransferase
MKHFITTSDYTAGELGRMIDLAIDLKRKKKKRNLNGKNLVLLFFNPSLRTRTSFEFAMQQLGGNVVTLNTGGDTWKLETENGVIMDGAGAEHIKDAAKVLGRYGDAVGIRAFAGGEDWEKDKKDPIIAAFAEHSGVPVINMESSLYHPNQALADIMTIREQYGKDLKGIPITITWANHPKPLPMAVPNSILLASASFGMDVRFLRPSGYDLDSTIIGRAQSLAQNAGGKFTVTDNIEEGFKDSKVVYAKSWGSLEYYGRPEEEKKHKISLGSWIVDDKKMDRTDNAIFMHCLPVRRGVVVSDSVIDSASSAVYDEAENRLHAQKAVLYHLLGE